MDNELKNIELRSEEVQEILSNPPSWMVRWGISLIFFSLLLILFASWIVKYPDFIDSKITITTTVPTEKIEAKTNGRIVKLLVKDQETVSKGQVLAVLENTARFNDVLLLKNCIDSFHQNYQKFNFPIHKVQSLDLGELEQDYALFEKAYTDHILNKKLKPYAVETLSGQQTLSELDARKHILEAQRALEQKELEVRRNDLNRTQALYKDGVISQVELETKELEFLQAQRNYENTKIALSQIQESKHAVHKSIQGSIINTTQDDTKFLKEVILSYEQLKRSLKQWEQTYLLQSSIDGRVSFQKFWGENQFVKTGNIVLTILPTQSSLIGKITTSATNTGKIHPNQKVLIKLDNYPYQEFGMIEGKIKSMSLAPDQEGNYYIEVSLPNHLHTTYNKDLIFNQEMQGSADIITEDLRLIERIFYQFRELFRYN